MKEYKTSPDFLAGYNQVLLTVFFVTLLLISWNYLIALYYFPDIGPIYDTIRAKISLPIECFFPEPIERFQYVSSLFLAPFAIGSVYYLIRRHIKEGVLRSPSISWVFSIPFILLLLMLSFKINTLDGVFWGRYIDPSILVKHPFVFLLTNLLFLLLTFFSTVKNRLNKIIYVISAILFLPFTVGYFFLWIFSTYIGYIPHLNAVLYPVTQVVWGKTLLVDFTNQYGLYPHFLEPIFRIFGISVLSFSVVMSLLACVCVILIFLFLIKNIKNSIVAILSFFTIMFYSAGLMAPEPYFQYWPIRTLFPFLIILLASLYFKNKNNKLYIIIFLLASLGILWNLDTGIVTFLGWILALIYQELFNTKRVFIKNSLRHIICSLIMITLTLISFSLFTYTRAGSFPNYFELLNYQGYFYSLGFGAIHMQLIQPWNLVILTYLIGLTYSIIQAFKRSLTDKATIIFLLSIIGLGIFSWYQGRSHDLSLVNIIPSAILILAIFSDKLLTIIARYKDQGKVLLPMLLVGLFVVFSSVALPSIIINHESLFERMTIGGNNLTKSKTYNPKVAFISEHTTKGEPILILADHQDGIFYAESKTQTRLNVPSSTEIFLKSDLGKIENFLATNTSTTKIFLDKEYSDKIVIAILERKYVRKELSSDNTMSLYINK
ncbi:MAG: hypothetical protein WC437_02445 [Patescibacteria group bacterium]